MDTDKMDFNSKNFRYITDTFEAFLQRAQRGDRLYLRSLSEKKPSESPANIKHDFPSLAADFILPKELQYVEDHLFSSILRISGRVNMWLHYDVSTGSVYDAQLTSRLLPRSRQLTCSLDHGKYLYTDPWLKADDTIPTYRRFAIGLCTWCLKFKS